MTSHPTTSLWTNQPPQTYSPPPTPRNIPTPRKDIGPEISIPVDRQTPLKTLPSRNFFGAATPNFFKYPP